MSSPAAAKPQTKLESWEFGNAQRGFGPFFYGRSPATVEATTSPPTAQTPSAAAGVTSFELIKAEMRARVMSNYKSGLR